MEGEPRGRIGPRAKTIDTYSRHAGGNPPQSDASHHRQPRILHTTHACSRVGLHGGWTQQKFQSLSKQPGGSPARVHASLKSHSAELNVELARINIDGSKIALARCVVGHRKTWCLCAMPKSRAWTDVEPPPCNDRQVSRAKPTETIKAPRERIPRGGNIVRGLRRE